MISWVFNCSLQVYAKTLRANREIFLGVDLDGEICDDSNYTSDMQVDVEEDQGSVL